MPHTGREGAIRSGMAHTAWHLRCPSEALPPGSRAGVWDRGSGLHTSLPREKRPQWASRILYTVAD